MSKIKYLAVILGGAAFLGISVLLLDLVPDAVLDRIAHWLVYGMVPPATLFPLLYLTFYLWWRNPVGRALMTKAIGLFLLINSSVAFTVLNAYDWYYADELQVVTFALVFLGLWYQMIVFIKIKVQAKRDETRTREAMMVGHIDSNTNTPT